MSHFAEGRITAFPFLPRAPHDTLQDGSKGLVQPEQDMLHGSDGGCLSVSVPCAVPVTRVRRKERRGSKGYFGGSGCVIIPSQCASSPGHASAGSVLSALTRVAVTKTPERHFAFLCAFSTSLVSTLVVLGYPNTLQADGILLKAC